MSRGDHRSIAPPPVSDNKKGGSTPLSNPQDRPAILTGNCGFNHAAAKTPTETHKNSPGESRKLAETNTPKTAKITTRGISRKFPGIPGGTNRHQETKNGVDLIRPNRRRRRRANRRNNIPRSLAGHTARQRAGQADSGTAAELAARLAIDYVSKQWQLLSQTDQQLWDLATLTHPLPNRLGRYRATNGFALWCQLGVNLVNAGQALNSTPPTDWITPPVLDPCVIATLTPTITSDYIASWNAATMIASVIVVKATGPTPWGQTPSRHQLRTVANLAPNTVPPVSLGSAWSAVYGLLPQSTPYQILWEFLPYSRGSGAQGPWVDFVASIGGPNPASPPTPATTPAAAPAIAESLNLLYTGSTGSAAWLALTTSPNVQYTAVWQSSNLTGTPTIFGGPSPSSLTSLHAFAEQDAYTFTAQTGWTYYIESDPWTAGSTWSVRYAPAQITTFPYAHLTGRTHRTWLIAEGTNERLVSDVFYQGPP